MSDLEKPTSLDRTDTAALRWDANSFSMISVFEAHWQTICSEFESIRAHLHPWVEHKLYRTGWQVYGLFDFPHGQALTANVARCPVTSALIQRELPQHGAAGFSVLEPGTEIQPHEGYAGNFLRFHLGLIVPEGDCCLQVEDATWSWQAGRGFVFDDRRRHAAWNRTASERVILLVDFVADEP